MAAAVNFYSITALYILSGLVGNGQLAAELAVIQGAILAFFLSLSGNARNLILSDGHAEKSTNIFYFRLILMLPACILTYLLINLTLAVSQYLVAILVLRKCCDWIAEIHLAATEKTSQSIYATVYIALNATGLLTICLMFFLESKHTESAMLIWALLPLATSLGFIFQNFKQLPLRMNFRPYLPHLGSSSVIGTTTYFFRIVIVLLIGMEFAGSMFTAYAIGSIISSVYTFAFGPSLIMLGAVKHLKFLFLSFTLCVTAGGIGLVANQLNILPFYDPIFVEALSFSLIGSGIMILAQSQRLYLLQIKKITVFVPDALANILILASVPIIFFLFGLHSMIYIYLWSAIINFVCYLPLLLNTLVSNETAQG